jgi:hypothetical protein
MLRSAIVMVGTPLMILSLPIHGLIIPADAAPQGPVEGESPSSVAEIIGFKSVVERVGQRREVIVE